MDGNNAPMAIDGNILDLNAPLVRDLPNAAPRPGELAREFVQVGYLSGVLLAVHCHYED